MAMDRFKDHIYETAQDVCALVLKKREAYGTANLTEQGLMGIIDRLGSDKLSRARTIVSRTKLRDDMRATGMPQDVIDEYAPPITTGDESLADTMQDVIGYALIFLAMMDGAWDTER